MKKSKKILAVILSVLLVAITMAPVLVTANEKNYIIDNPYEEIDWDSWGEYKTQLHCHTNASDGFLTIDEFVRIHYAANFDIVALTDHGVMYGAVDFYKACKAEGIKPIIGCEVYVTRNRFDKSGRGGDNEYFHLILLCKNKQGYDNLIQIVSAGFIDGFYYKPRVDAEVLNKYKGGLIALSACLAGEIPRLLFADKFDEAKEKVSLARIEELVAKEVNEKWKDYFASCKK